MVEVAEISKPRNKVSFASKIKDIALIVCVGFIIVYFTWIKDVDSKDKEYAWIFLFVVAGTIIVMYLLQKKKKVWNPYKVAEDIVGMSPYNNLNTGWDAWELHNSDRNPNEKYFYFKKSEPPFLITWNMLDECISERRIISPILANKLSNENKRLDILFNREQEKMKAERIDQESGLVPDDSEEDDG